MVKLTVVASGPAGSPAEDRASRLAKLIARHIGAPADEEGSLVVQIACDIAQAILEGRLGPQDDLNTVTLARQYQTSRTPIREALLLLQKQGLVEIPPRRRPRVAAADISQAQEIYPVRAALHALVAELAAANATQEGLTLLRDRFEDMRRAAEQGDEEEYFFANLEFHEAMSEVCRNPTAQATLATLGLRTYQFRRVSLGLAGRRDQSLEDHLRLVRAIEDRDPALAGALMRANILGAMRALVSLHERQAAEAGRAERNP